MTTNKGARRPARYTITTTIRMPEEIRDRMKELAKRRKQSVSDLVRTTVRIFEELEKVEQDGGYLAVVDGKGATGKLLLS